MSFHPENPAQHRNKLSALASAALGLWHLIGFSVGKLHFDWKFSRILAVFSACAMLATLVSIGEPAARAQAAPAPATTPAPAQAAPAATPAPAQSPSTAITTPSAKDILGIWQGTLHIEQANRDLRIEVRIAKTASGEYKTTFYSIDQGGQPLGANKTSFEDGTLTFSMDAIGGKYVGKMSPDGKTITGTWTQGPNPMALNLERTTEDAAWPIPEAPKPMAPDANPSFEVATIKPNNSGATQMQGLVIQGRKFLTRASSLDDLISFAYNVQTKQILGGPAWTGSDRYDIEALPDAEGVPNAQQIRTMIQKLLADRFKLTFHHEQRDMPAYVLEVAKGGEKLTPTQTKGNLPALGFGPGTGGITLRAINATIGDLAGMLQLIVLDRPVVDRTGIEGRYDLKCTFTPDDSQFNGHPPRLPSPSGGDAQGSTADTAAAPSLYEAMQQELGLKLTPEKTGVDVMVVDHVEKPSPN